MLNEPLWPLSRKDVERQWQYTLDGVTHYLLSVVYYTAYRQSAIDAKTGTRVQHVEDNLFAGFYKGFRYLSYGYYYDYGCLWIALADISSGGTRCEEWPSHLRRHRIKGKNDRWNDDVTAFIVQEVDKLVHTILSGVNQDNTIGYCNGIYHRRSHAEFLEPVGDKWLCSSCMNQFSLAAPIPETKQETNVQKTERQKMTKQLRFQILERDGFKCRVCGRNPNDHGVVLHVDHIHPIAKGGKTVPKNLQTLCSDCNLAKSDNVIEQMSLWNWELEFPK